MILTVRIALVFYLLVVIGASVIPECTKWTKFYDRDDPGGISDFEHLFYLRAENPGEICNEPTAVDVRLSDGRPYTEGKDDIFVTTEYGLVCYNIQQPDGRCNDYKIRFCCP